MQRISALDPQTAEGKSRLLFDLAEKKLGMVPNMMRIMGNSPAVLNGYLLFCDALGQGSIGGKLSEQIALTVANKNGSEYCITAHTFITANIFGLDPDTILLARQGKSSNKKTQAALTFSIELIERRVSDESIEALRSEGYGDGEIMEIIAHTAFNMFTNFVNVAAQAKIDFPIISLK